MDVENLLRVRDLIYRDGFTIAGAKKQLQRGGVEPAELEGPAGPARLESAGEPEAAAPTSGEAEGAPLSGGDPRVRAKLSALRAEVEAFLAELAAPSPARTPDPRTDRR